MLKFDQYKHYFFGGKGLTIYIGDIFIDVQCIGWFLIPLRFQVFFFCFGFWVMMFSFMFYKVFPNGKYQLFIWNFSNISNILEFRSFICVPLAFHLFLTSYIICIKIRSAWHYCWCAHKIILYRIYMQQSESKVSILCCYSTNKHK